MKKILFLMTAVLVIAGCSKSEDGKLTLSANQVSLYSGDTKQVTVNDNATWSSKSEFVAEVSEDGIIKEIMLEKQLSLQLQIMERRCVKLW